MSRLLDVQLLRTEVTPVTLKWSPGVSRHPAQLGAKACQPAANCSACNNVYDSKCGLIHPLHFSSWPLQLGSGCSADNCFSPEASANLSGPSLPGDSKSANIFFKETKNSSVTWLWVRKNKAALSTSKHNANDKTRQRSSVCRQWEGHRLNEPRKGLVSVSCFLLSHWSRSNYCQQKWLRIRDGLEYMMSISCLCKSREACADLYVCGKVQIVLEQILGW